MLFCKVSSYVPSRSKVGVWKRKLLEVAGKSAVRFMNELKPFSDVLALGMFMYLFQ